MGFVLPVLFLSIVAMLVWVPLGVFVWIGLPVEAFTFQPGHRWVAVFLLVLFYAVHTFVCIRIPRMRRPFLVSLVVLGVWIVGFLGFAREVYSIGTVWGR